MIEKAALISIHKQLVKSGFMYLAQALLQHLTGFKPNNQTINFLLTSFNYSDKT
ncbi:MAG: hypothetical protein ABR980_11725 [Ignavibacteriaceae bacterium]|jgi:hypothetical protein